MTEPVGAWTVAEVERADTAVRVRFETDREAVIRGVFVQEDTGTPCVDIRLGGAENVPRPAARTADLLCFTEIADDLVTRLAALRPNVPFEGYITEYTVVISEGEPRPPRATANLVRLNN